MPEPRHRAPRKRGPAYLAALGATAAAAVSTAIILPGSPAPARITEQPPLDQANDAHVLPVTLAQVPPVHQARPATYRVVAGDTLSGVAALRCDNPNAYRALAANNHIRYADFITPGEVIEVACHAAAAVLARVQLAPPNQPAAPGRPAAPVLAAAVTPVQSTAQQSARATGGTLGCAGLEQLWDAAGGNPSDAFMAAEIAMAESGGNQYALSPTDDFGYWQINASNGSLATYNALGNAKSAIILSDDGANWGAWTTYTEGLYAGKC